MTLAGGLGMQTKSAIKSVGFWGSLGTAILPILMAAGVVPPDTDMTIAAIASAISSIVALYGRWRAKSPLSVSGS